MIPAPVAAILWKVAPYAIAAVALLGWFAVHDYRVRAKEAKKWEEKLVECKKQTATAVETNAKLETEYKGFVAEHNRILFVMAKNQSDAFKRRDEAINMLKDEEKKSKAVEDELRKKAAAGPRPTKEIACVEADTTLRDLATELLRDDAANQRPR